MTIKIEQIVCSETSAREIQSPGIIRKKEYNVRLMFVF
jgi:hypothetical protein